MKTIIDKKLEDPEFARIFSEQSFELELFEEVCRVMQEQKVSYAEVAKRLRKVGRATSAAEIKKLLGGYFLFNDEEGTVIDRLHFVAAMFHVLNHKVTITAKPLEKERAK